MYSGVVSSQVSCHQDTWLNCQKNLVLKCTYAKKLLQPSQCQSNSHSYHEYEFKALFNTQPGIIKPMGMILQSLHYIDCSMFISELRENNKFVEVSVVKN